MLTTAVAFSPRPSSTRYVKESVPTKFNLGVYRRVPAAVDTVAVPRVGVLTNVAERVRGSPSGSLSFDRGLIVTATFLAVVAVSPTATGALLAGGGAVTVTVTVPTAFSPSL
jgi:hypothetical protein